ncbi:hypothetical protein CSUI_007475, partial [Cystoisospora suis]
RQQFERRRTHAVTARAESPLRTSANSSLRFRCLLRPKSCPSTSHGAGTERRRGRASPGTTGGHDAVWGHPQQSGRRLIKAVAARLQIFVRDSLLCSKGKAGSEYVLQ